MLVQMLFGCAVWGAVCGAGDGTGAFLQDRRPVALGVLFAGTVQGAGAGALWRLMAVCHGACSLGCWRGWLWGDGREHRCRCFLG